MLDAPIVVTFDGSEVSYTYLLTVTNTSRFTLPSTGGVGTLIFTISGIVLLGLAAIVALSKKRKTDLYR
jgi:LPXTG-motif cell wall-anchored protein